MSEYLPPEPVVIHRPGTPENPFVLTAKGRALLGVDTLPAPRAPALPSIGQRIAALRAAHGFTQSSLARAMCTSPSAVSLLESGERNPSYGTLAKLADAFGITIAALVEGTAPSRKGAA